MDTKKELASFVVCYDCYGFREFDSDFEPENDADYSTCWKELGKYYKFSSRTEEEPYFSRHDCECCGQCINGDAFEYQGYRV